jgi:hypothetical protein
MTLVDLGELRNSCLSKQKGFVGFVEGNWETVQRAKQITN